MDSIKTEAKYAVSDEAGEYVCFTDCLVEAEELRDEINATLHEEDAEGSAAIMKWDDETQDYSLFT